MEKTIKIPSDGFVRLVDWMGNDEAIVQAARVSYGDGTKTPSDDRKLIRYLIEHQHTTPLEMCEIKFHVRVPMDTWRQWIRHRTASVNEYSTRYSIAIDSMKTTESDQWRKQSTKNKQGSGEFFSEEEGLVFSKNENEFQDLAKSVYKGRIESGMAREQARKDLPLSTYTEAYWKIDLHNLLHFLGLRLPKEAQQEIREYAEAISVFIKELFPITWEAFEYYNLSGITFYPDDISAIKRVIKENRDYGFDLSEENVRMLLGSDGKDGREFNSRIEKLKKIGIIHES